MTKQPESALLWIKKADNDLKVGLDELITENPATDVICFHMQQCAEKYLKGYLVYFGYEIEKTHNIGRILELCVLHDSSFSELSEANIALLTLYAVELRYPDDFYMPSLEETKEAVSLAETVKIFVRKKLCNDGFNFMENVTKS
jgi:HEPN domain-containing protein